MRQENNTPTPESMKVAAQLWCLPQHSKKEMDADFAESIAVVLDLAVQKEREECAKVAYSMENADNNEHIRIAKAIRQRGEGV